MYYRWPARDMKPRGREMVALLSLTALGAREAAAEEGDLTLRLALSRLFQPYHDSGTGGRPGLH